MLWGIGYSLSILLDIVDGRWISKVKSPILKIYNTSIPFDLIVWLII